MFCFAFALRSPAVAPLAAAAAATVGPADVGRSVRVDSSPLASENAEFAESASWSGPNAPAPLGAPGPSHRVSVYETARRTFAGTANSAAALANAVCRDDGAALAEDPSVARTRLVLARSAAMRARERVTCNTDPLLMFAVDVGAERLLRTTVTSGSVCVPAT
jgi:hypothetical protein